MSDRRDCAASMETGQLASGCGGEWRQPGFSGEGGADGVECGDAVGGGVEVASSYAAPACEGREGMPVAGDGLVALGCWSFSQGWGIPVNLMAASPRAVARTRSRQVSRGYSVSQPAPDASASTRRRVEDERAPAVPASPRRTGGPPFLGPVQQGRYARGGQHGRERPHVLRRQPGVLLVAAALQDVLHFQAEPGGQPLQVDVLLARAGGSPGSRRTRPRRGDRSLSTVRGGHDRTRTCPGPTGRSSRSGRPPPACPPAPARSMPARQPGPGGPRGATAWRAGCTVRGPPRRSCTR
jgi:hypothetical protein